MDIYQVVTNRIMDQLDSGIIPWHKPWIASGSAVSHITGKPVRRSYCKTYAGNTEQSNCRSDGRKHP